MSEKLRLRSTFAIEEQAAAVVVEGDVLKNVPLHGYLSKNGNEYSLEAMRSLVPLLEGMDVYVNHRVGKKARDVDERFGHAQNVRLVERDHDGKPRIRGDLPFLRSHRDAAAIVEAYQKGTRYFGTSIVADGIGRKEGNKRFVEQITSVSSLDLVDKAATGSLVEQEGGDDEAPPMPMDPAQQLKDGLIQMVAAIINDDSLDAAAKKEKIGALIDAHGDTSGGDSAPPPPPEMAGDGPMSEQARQEYRKKLATYFGTLVEQKQKAANDAIAALTAQVAGLAGQVATLVEQGGKPRKYTSPSTPGEPATTLPDPKKNGKPPVPTTKEDRERFLRKP